MIENYLRLPDLSKHQNLFLPIPRPHQLFLEPHKTKEKSFNDIVETVGGTFRAIIVGTTTVVLPPLRIGSSIAAKRFSSPRYYRQNHESVRELQLDKNSRCYGSSTHLFRKQYEVIALNRLRNIYDTFSISIPRFVLKFPTRSVYYNQRSANYLH